MVRRRPRLQDCDAVLERPLPRCPAAPLIVLSCTSRASTVRPATWAPAPAHSMQQLCPEGGGAEGSQGLLRPAGAGGAAQFGAQVPGGVPARISPQIIHRQDCCHCVPSPPFPPSRGGQAHALPAPALARAVSGLRQHLRLLPCCCNCNWLASGADLRLPWPPLLACRAHTREVQQEFEALFQARPLMRTLLCPRHGCQCIALPAHRGMTHHPLHLRSPSRSSPLPSSPPSLPPFSPGSSRPCPSWRSSPPSC